MIIHDTSYQSLYNNNDSSNNEYMYVFDVTSSAIYDKDSSATSLMKMVLYKSNDELDAGTMFKLNIDTTSSSSALTMKIRNLMIASYNTANIIRRSNESSYYHAVLVLRPVLYQQSPLLFSSVLAMILHILLITAVWYICINFKYC